MISVCVCVCVLGEGENNKKENNHVGLNYFTEIMLKIQQIVQISIISKHTLFKLPKY
jgi:hypothetical protein